MQENNERLHHNFRTSLKERFSSSESRFAKFIRSSRSFNNNPCRQIQNLPFNTLQRQLHKTKHRTDACFCGNKPESEQFHIDNNN